jgi:putative ATP-binding cassette transporter
LILYFCAIAAVAIVGAVYRLYLTQMLTIRWRAWLTEKHFARWLADKITTSWSRAVTPITRTSGFPKTSITSPQYAELGIGLLRNIVSLVSFSIILWGVSGSIEVSASPFPATCSGACWSMPWWAVG